MLKTVQGYSAQKDTPALAAPSSQQKQGVHYDAKITTLARNLQLKTGQNPQFITETVGISECKARTAD